MQVSRVISAFLALSVFIWVQPAVGQSAGTQSTIYDLTADYSGDGIPDRLNLTSTISGKVVAESGAIPGDEEAFYLQDSSGGIMVTGVDGPVSYLEELELSGKIVQTGDRFVFVAENTVRSVSKTPRLGATDFAGDEERKYRALTRAAGRVVDTFESGSSNPGFALSTAAGLVNIRVAKSSPVTMSIGDKVRVTGVLVESESGWHVPEILVSEASQVAPIVDLNQYKGLVQKIAIGLGILLALLALRFVISSRPSKRDPFRVAVLQADAAMLFVDLSGKIFFANPAASRLCERTKKQMSLMKITSLFTFDEPLDNLVAELKEGQSVTIDAKLSRVESKSVEVHVTRTKVKRQDALLIVVQDISSHSQSLSQFKQFYEKLLSGLPLAVSVMSAEGRYLFVNELEFGEGVNPDSVVGKSDIECAKVLGLTTEVTLRRRAHRRRAVNTKAPIRFDEEINDGVSDKQYIRIYQPLTDVSGSEVVAIATYGLDVTELRQSQNELDRARVEIGKVNHIKELLIENLNSEFRKPISGIIGFAEILEGEVNEEQREFVNHIERNGRRLMNTLNSVLDLAGLKNHDVELQIGVVDLVEQAREITDLSREMAQEKGLFIELRTERPNVYGRADNTCITRILQNLIDNAIKFTENGGIIVEVASNDQAVQIRVIDSGAGIDSSFLPFIFDDFNQELPPSAMTGDGVGIGLGVTKRLVELMQGSISVESKKGEGSTFIVNIPRAFPYRSAFTAGRPRLLYVDSSEESRSIVSYLMNEHFSVDVASSLDELTTLSGLTKYDLVVTDVSQPDFNMWSEWLKVFRQKCDSLYVPVVATDDPRGGAMTRALDGGYDYFIGKPFKKAALTNLLSQVMTDRKRLGDIHGNTAGPSNGSAAYPKAS